MKFEVFSIKDRATDQFGNPMFLMSEGHARRVFTDEVNREGRGEERNMMFMHPEDFSLYYLGSYESSTGVFETKSPTLVVLGDQVKVR